MNSKYKKIIKCGKIQDNYLVNFPQHILIQENNMYSIEINGGFVFKLNIPVDNYVFELPIIYLEENQYKYNFNIYWGDNIISKITNFSDINKQHTYINAGEYIVYVIGDCFGFNNKTYIEKYEKNNWEYLTDILNWSNFDISLLNYRIL